MELLFELQVDGKRCGAERDNPTQSLFLLQNKHRDQSTHVAQVERDSESEVSLCTVRDG